MKYTKETFTAELQKRFPDNKFEILEFTGTYKPIKYKCLKCGRIIEKNRANHLYENKSLCQHCYSTKNSAIRDWITNFFNTTQQFNLISWSGNTMDNLIIHCNNCNLDFEKQPSNLYNRNENTICPYCGDNGAPIPQILFEQFMIEKGYTDYKVIEYKAIGRSVKFQHLSCGYTFSQIGMNFLHSRGCPKCNKRMSKGELKIESFLINHNIQYIYNYKIKEINNYSYDFYLPTYNTFIEYQGEQHYFPVSYFGGEDKLRIQQDHDKIKEKYAKEHGYNLIIIPYTDYNNIDSYLIPLGSTTSQFDVASSEAKEKSTNYQ